MSRIIQRLAAFAIFSCILLTGCGGRPVTVSGLFAQSKPEGESSTLNFKIRNPTTSEIVLTGIALQIIEKDVTGDGVPEKFIYSYTPEIHHIQPQDQGGKDEVVKEVKLSPGQIIDFKFGGDYYILLRYQKPPDKPETEFQKGLPAGQLMAVDFAFATTRMDSSEPKKEIREAILFPRQEAYIK